MDTREKLNAADRQKAKAAARDQQVLAWFDGQSGSANAVAKAVGMPERSARRSLARLVDRGLLIRDGSTWQRVEAASPPVDPEGLFPPEFDELLARLPAEPLRAAVRLGLALIVAKRALYARRASGWPNLILFGPPRTGKTLVARILGRAAGLPDPQAVRLAAGETGRSLFVRRALGRRGWSLAASPALTQHFVAIDELDKVPPALRGQLLALAQGDTVVELEAQEIRVRPALCLAGNASGDTPPWLSPHLWRRSVVVNTARFRDAFTDGATAEAVRSLLTKIPHLPVVGVPTELPATVFSLLAAALADSTAPYTGARERIDATFAEPLALGYLALAGGSPERAALQAVADYVTTATTTGLTNPAAVDALTARLAGLSGGGEPVGSLTLPEPPLEPEPEPDPNAPFGWRRLCQEARAGWDEATEDAIQAVAADWTPDTPCPVANDLRWSEAWLESQVRQVFGLPAATLRHHRSTLPERRKVFAAVYAAAFESAYATWWGERARLAQEEARVRGEVAAQRRAALIAQQHAEKAALQQANRMAAKRDVRALLFPDTARLDAATALAKRGK